MSNNSIRNLFDFGCDLVKRKYINGKLYQDEKINHKENITYYTYYDKNEIKWYTLI